MTPAAHSKYPPPNHNVEAPSCKRCYRHAAFWDTDWCVWVCGACLALRHPFHNIPPHDHLLPSAMTLPFIADLYPDEITHQVPDLNNEILWDEGDFS